MKQKMFFDIESLCDQEFFKKHWKKEIKVWKGALKEQLFDYEKLNDILNTFEFSTEDLRLVRGDQFYNMQKLVEKNAHDSKHRLNRYSKIDSLKLNEVLRRDTYSVRFFSLSKYDVEFKRFARHVEQLTHRRCDSIGIYTPEGQSAFSWHADDFNGLAVQTEGKKTWRIAPLGKDGSDGDYREVTLEKGDVLYFPEGLFHQVFTEDTPSLHVTFALRELELKELMNVFLHQLDNPLFKKRFAYEENGFGVNEAATKKLLREGVFGLNKVFNDPHFVYAAEGLLLGGIEKQKHFINLPYGGQNTSFRLANTEEALVLKRGEGGASILFRGRKYPIGVSKEEFEQLITKGVFNEKKLSALFPQVDIVELLTIGLVEEI